jgi:hypothetical protein
LNKFSFIVFCGSATSGSLPIFSAASIGHLFFFSNFAAQAHGHGPNTAAFCWCTFFFFSA